MSQKTEIIELKLPNQTAVAISQIAKLAGTSEKNVVKVALAMYAGAWIGARTPPVEKKA